MKRVAISTLVIGAFWVLALPLVATGTWVPPNQHSIIPAVLVVAWTALWSLPIARRRWGEMAAIQWLTCGVAVILMVSFSGPHTGTWILRFVFAAIFGTLAFGAWMAPVGLINSFVERRTRDHS